MTDFGERAEGIERADRPGEPEGGADVAERRRGRADRLERTNLEPGAGGSIVRTSDAGHEQADVDHPEGETRSQRPLIDHPPLRRIGTTASRWTVWSSSRRSELADQSRCRTTLIAPPVEPAEPPIEHQRERA